MTLFEYYKSIDTEEIDRYISEAQEENVSLEFKTVNHPNYNDQNRDFDKRNFSSALSGFANSNGGIIIWGVKASKNSQGQDVASAVAPIAELTRFLNFLNRNEGQAVIPVLSGIVHEKLETGGDKGYIKSFIPPSDSAPHMALFAGKHYYKRSGDSFYQCEHYDIIDMFSRKKSPDLELFTRILQRSNVSSDKYRYEIILGIRNKGKAMAKYPYMAINCNHQYRAFEFGLDGNRNCGLYKVANNTRYRFNYAGGSEVVIYPDAELDVDKFMTEIYRTEAPEDFKITYMLSAENMVNLTGEIVLDTRAILSSSV